MLNINKIGLGTVQFGLPYGISNKNGQTSHLEVKQIIDYATNIGIRYIDTAYGYGEAEEVIGQNDLSKFRIISKFALLESNETLEDQLSISLKRLNLKSIYGYMAHIPLSLLDDDKLWNDLLRLKSEKKVEKIGYSLNSPLELEQLLSKDRIPDIIQVPYNYFDNRFKDQLIELKKNGCEIHTRSCFLQGLFFSDTTTLSSHFDAVKPIINSLQTQEKENLSGALLKTILSHDFIDVVVIGVENLDQLKINIQNIETSSILEPLNKHFTDKILMPSNWPKK
jgi:aryl-alcohol dehydrogenase-like predicted oxidoreductase